LLLVNVMSDADKDAVVHDVTTQDDTAAIDLQKPELERLVKRSVMVALSAESFRGPMPRPDDLRQYDAIVPGAARIILEEFQANSKHSRYMDVTALDGMIRKDQRAQWMASVLVFIGFGLVYGLAEHGHDTVAGAVAVTLLVAILAAFLTGKVGGGKDEPEDEDDTDK